jgi:hypothetical protein
VTEGLFASRDHRAAQTAGAAIENRRLSGRHGALRRVELDVEPTVRQWPDTTGLIVLSIAHFHHRFERRLRRRVEQPMRAFGLHSGAGERGMVVTLYDDQCITNRIFVRDVPSVFGMTRAPTDLESATLAERVVRESAMRAEALAVQRFDRAGLTPECIVRGKSRNGRSPMKQMPVLSGLS